MTWYLNNADARATLCTSALASRSRQRLLTTSMLGQAAEAISGGSPKRRGGIRFRSDQRGGSARDSATSNGIEHWPRAGADNRSLQRPWVHSIHREGRRWARGQRAGCGAAAAQSGRRSEQATAKLAGRRFCRVSREGRLQTAATSRRSLYAAGSATTLSYTGRAGSRGESGSKISVISSESNDSVAAFYESGSRARDIAQAMADCDCSLARMSAASCRELRFFREAAGDRFGRWNESC
jgi:hypothetical protein